MAIMAGALIDVADFGDTGWVDVTVNSGYTDSGFQLRRIGSAVYARGLVSPDTDWGVAMATNSVATIDAAFCPATSVVTWLGLNATTSTSVARMSLTSAGALTIRLSTGGATASVYFTNLTWLVD